MRIALAALLLCGCGRIAFDRTSDGGGAVGDTSMVVDAPAGSITMTFGELPAATRQNVTSDTSISNAGPAGDNYGATDYMIIQAASAAVSLVRFDVSGAMPTLDVFSATLRLTMVGGGMGDVTAYEMLEAWDEGTGDGTPGDASYNERQPGVAWSGIGATAPSRDTVSRGMGTFTGVGNGTDIALAPSLVQKWIALPASNFGVALLGTSVNTDVATREAAAVDTRPLLTLVLVPR